MKSVWDIPKGVAATIAGLDQSLAPEVVHRLRDIGFAADQPVLCLHRGFLGGPVVVSVADTVFSLEQQIACRILIVPSA